MSVRLRVELVPSSSWGDNLRSRLSRSDWDTLRRSVYERAGHRCEVCGGRGRKHPVECHERWEYDDEKHVQKLVGLEALCPSCHAVRHMGRSIAIGDGPRVMAHLAKINGWTFQEASEHVEGAFQVHAQRSQHDWTLDLTWLSTSPTTRTFDG